MIDEATITVSVEQPFRAGAERKMLRYKITREQAMELAVGPRPPDFDSWACRDWTHRMERAETLARHIAADLAHTMLQAFNE